MDYKPIILEELTVLKKKEQQDGNTFKAIAYGKVIKQLEAFKKINSIDDLQSVTGIGKSIQEKLEEIFKTGMLKAAQKVKKDIKLPVIDQFMNIYGIGRVKANNLVKEQKIMSLEELRERSAKDPTLLNTNQKIGLEFYEDFLERIPRSEMDKHNTKLQAILQEFHVQGDIVGSYRRGEPSSGDIDFLVKSSDKKLLEKLVEELKVTNYITHVLALGDKKCMAVCKLGKTARRLDILLTPPEEYAFALLYFTGSDKFNIAMRKHALTKNLSLNEHGFTPKSPFLATEEDIFKYIDFPYIPPEDRKRTF